MQFELTVEYFEQLRSAIEQKNDAYIREQVSDLYPIDIALILNKLDLEEAKYIYELLDEEVSADVILEMEEDKREALLSTFSTKEIAEQLDYMESDDAADMISELPEEIQDEVLSHIEDIEQASDIADLLNYEEGTAGSLMAKELVSVYAHETVGACIDEIRRQADNVEVMYAVYVVDDNEKLIGMLSLKKLIISHPLARIEEIYVPDVHFVKTSTTSEEVASIIQKYDLVVLPVVDQLGRLVGRITIDDVVDVIKKEETEDQQKMAGIEALDYSYSSTSFLELIKKRVGWLIILFIGESFTATAMSFFEDKIEKAVILALFVPLIISSGGNTGSQASTLIIRALALGEIKLRDWWRIIKKELLVGLSLGLILAMVGFLRVAVWSMFVDTYGPHWLMVAITVSISLVGVVLWGNIIGSLLPLLLKRLGLDPAVSSAPFVATLVDVTGLVIYFTAAAMLLRGILL